MILNQRRYPKKNKKTNAIAYRRHRSSHCLPLQKNIRDLHVRGQRALFRANQIHSET